MDAGCGTGRLTGELLAMLPAGRAVGVDLSANMLQTAREYLREPFGGRVHFVKADLQALPFSLVFDGIFSTAAFHWVTNHDRLFENLFTALRPGGWLCAQCGGGANLARTLARASELARDASYAHYMDGFEKGWLFADADATAARLRRAGFVDVRTDLEEAPTVLNSAAEYRQFVANVILRSALERLPDAALREQFLDEFTRRAGEDRPPYQLDYWRLNIEARRPE
jgi:trans-aconitate 2-methyltransferase